MSDESKNGTWAKYAAIAVIATTLLGAVSWTFGVSVTANEAKALASENRQTLKETLAQKADKDDIQDLKDEIRDLREQVRQLQDDLDHSAFIKHTRRKDDNN